MNFAILDGVVIAVVLISAILAMFRGFVREVLSIAAWVAAAVLAYVFYDDLVPYISDYLTSPTLAIAISAAAIFLVSLIVVSLITMKISDFVSDSSVGALDRLLGFLFGTARGVLLVVVAAIFFNWIVRDEDRPAWITSSFTYPELTRLGVELQNAMPASALSAITGAFDETGEALQDAGEALQEAAPEEDAPATPPRAATQSPPDQPATPGQPVAPALQPDPAAPPAPATPTLPDTPSAPPAAPATTPPPATPGTDGVAN